jgi:hypothetical protein
MINSNYTGVSDEVFKVRPFTVGSSMAWLNLYPSDRRAFAELEDKAGQYEILKVREDEAILSSRSSWPIIMHC